MMNDLSYVNLTTIWTTPHQDENFVRMTPSITLGMQRISMRKLKVVQIGSVSQTSMERQGCFMTIKQGGSTTMRPMKTRGLRLKSSNNNFGNTVYIDPAKDRGWPFHNRMNTKKRSWYPVRLRCHLKMRIHQTTPRFILWKSWMRAKNQLEKETHGRLSTKQNLAKSNSLQHV